MQLYTNYTPHKKYNKAQTLERDKIIIYNQFQYSLEISCNELQKHSVGSYVPLVSSSNTYQHNCKVTNYNSTTVINKKFKTSKQNKQLIYKKLDYLQWIKIVCLNHSLGCSFLLLSWSIAFCRIYKICEWKPTCARRRVWTSQYLSTFSFHADLVLSVSARVNRSTLWMSTLAKSKWPEVDSCFAWLNICSTS